MKVYSRALIEEIEEIIDIDRILKDSAKTRVLFDGRQYTLKVPKKLAEKADLEAGMEFEFTVKRNLREGKILFKGRLIDDTSQK